MLDPQFNSSLNTLLNDALQTVLLGVASAVAYGVKLWINSMNSEWKQVLAERLVKYAEQKVEGDTEKQKWVADQLSAKLKGRVSSDEVNHLIEEAFVNMKAQLTPPAVVAAPVAVIAPTTEVKPS